MEAAPVIPAGQDGVRNALLKSDRESLLFCSYKRLAQIAKPAAAAPGAAVMGAEARGCSLIAKGDVGQIDVPVVSQGSGDRE